MNKRRTRTSVLLADAHPVFRGVLRSLLKSESNLRIVGEASDCIQTVALARQTVPDILLLDFSIVRFSNFEVLRNISRFDKDIRVLVLAPAMTKTEILYGLQLGATGVLWKGSAESLLLKSIRCVMNGEFWISRHIVDDLLEELRMLSFPHSGERTAVSKPLQFRDPAIGFAGPGAQKRKSAKQKHAATSFRGGEAKYGLTAREVEIINSIVHGESNYYIALKFGISEHTVRHHLSSIYDKIGVHSRLELAVFAIHHDLSAPLDHLPRGA